MDAAGLVAGGAAHAAVYEPGVAGAIGLQLAGTEASAAV